MTRVIRRIGPLVLWQYVNCVVGIPLYFGMALLTLERTWPSRLLVSGVLLALLAAIVVFRNPLFALIDRVALVDPDGASPRRARVLRLERHADVFLLGGC